MPKGLSAVERLRWKKEHPDYVNTEREVKNKPKGKPAVANKELDKDMPDEIRNGTKLDQLKWRKKQAQQKGQES
jgi:hypothetical protein